MAVIQKQNLSFQVGPYYLDLNTRPLIMGILNVTPDSFSEEGQFFKHNAAIEHAQRMIAEGVDIIDVGGESSRPGADPVTLEEEKRRVWPLIEALAKLKVPVSIDTYKAEIAAGALERGAVIVNDISAGNFDPMMPRIVARHDAAYVLMHIQGTPQNMQKNPQYQDLMKELIDYLNNSLKIAVEAGVDKKKIILDPGIGFGKTLQHNLEILKRFEELHGLGQPLLIGTSRKSFIGAITGLPVEKRLPGTAASVLWAVERGANIVRVHDVGPIKELLQVAQAMKAGGDYCLENQWN